MNITVNALGVGKGKTLSDVIPRIKTAISNPLSTPIILTLPSTTSQFDLADQINSPDLIIINLWGATAGIEMSVFFKSSADSLLAYKISQSNF